ncbi:MAG TPA: CocE/NonD family hydrolase [Thermoanaerobaculaceae bacterium]|nr:CocE/NonD family hydrolase [Thermoanaerobaculaceae bacterium]
MHAATTPRRRVARRAGVACACAVIATAAVARTRQTVAIPMRDGAALAGDVYLPGPGSWPVILIQTPYNKNLFAAALSGAGDDPLFASPEYAFVVTDWRGYFASAAAASPGYDRGLDGYDTVEWIAAQPFSNGRVGTWGASALGVVQFQTAAAHPPHLRAAVPEVAHLRDTYELYYPGGVYARNKNTFVATVFGGDALVRAHPTDDLAWQAVEAAGIKGSDIDVPMLIVSGWYDHETDLTLAAASEIQSEGGPHARGLAKVLVGPWSHSHLDEADQNALSFPAAAGEAARRALAFFDLYLRGVATGADAWPFVTYFRIHDDVWREAGAWPPPAVTTALRLGEDGTLAPVQPSSPAPVSWTSDPTSPVPTLFGAILIQTTGWTQGPGDLTPIESRRDVLTFTTPILAQPLRIEGRATATAWIASTAVDADLAVRLTDVDPAGHSWLLVDSIRRASLRDSYGSRELLSPGVPVEVAVELPSLAATIPAGHRLRVDVAASNYDRFDVNLQDGSSLSDAPGGVPTPAEVTLRLDDAHPAVLELPLVADHVVRRHVSRGR